jgi:hypothetical protein
MNVNFCIEDCIHSDVMSIKCLMRYKIINMFILRIFEVVDIVFKEWENLYVTAKNTGKIK